MHLLLQLLLQLIDHVGHLLRRIYFIVLYWHLQAFEHFNHLFSWVVLAVHLLLPPLSEVLVAPGWECALPVEYSVQVLV